MGLAGFGVLAIAIWQTIELIPPLSRLVGVIASWKLVGIFAAMVAGTLLCAGYWIFRQKTALMRSQIVAQGLREIQTALRRRTRVLEQEARTDSLTGVGNRLLLAETLEFEVNRSDLYDDPLSMAVVEIGGLRRLHVRTGRQAVDESIRQAANRIQDCVEASDWVFRWSDGEFLAIWLNTDAVRADQRSVRLHGILREGCLRDGQDLPVSVAATTYVRHEGVDRFLARLDLAKKDLARGGVCHLGADSTGFDQASEF